MPPDRTRVPGTTLSLIPMHILKMPSKSPEVAHGENEKLVTGNLGEIYFLFILEMI